MLYIFTDNDQEYKIDVPDDFINLSRRNLGWNSKQSCLVYAVDTLNMELSKELMDIVTEAKLTNAKTDVIMYEQNKQKSKGTTGPMLAAKALSLIVDSWDGAEKVDMRDSKGKIIYCFSLGDDVFEIKICKKRKPKA